MLEELKVKLFHYIYIIRLMGKIRKLYTGKFNYKCIKL